MTLLQVGLCHAKAIVVKGIAEFRYQMGEGKSPMGADAGDDEVVVSGV